MPSTSTSAAPLRLPSGPLLIHDEQGFMSGGEDVGEVAAPLPSSRAAPCGFLSGGEDLPSDSETVTRTSAGLAAATSTTAGIHANAVVPTGSRRKYKRRALHVDHRPTTMTPLRLSYDFPRPLAAAKAHMFKGDEDRQPSCSSPSYRETPAVRLPPLDTLPRVAEGIPAKSVSAHTKPGPICTAAAPKARPPPDAPALKDMTDQELLRLRFESQRKLATTFEALFEKYSVSFEGEADVLDLETMRVVEDNGYLRSLGDRRVEFGGESDGGDDDEFGDGGRSCDDQHLTVEADVDKEQEQQGSNLARQPAFKKTQRKRGRPRKLRIADETPAFNAAAPTMTTSSALGYESGGDDHYLSDSFGADTDLFAILRQRKAELIAARRRLNEEDRRVEDKVESGTPIAAHLDAAFLSGGEEVEDCGVTSPEIDANSKSDDWETEDEQEDTGNVSVTGATPLRPAPTSLLAAPILEIYQSPVRYPPSFARNAAPATARLEFRQPSADIISSLLRRSALATNDDAPAADSDIVSKRKRLETPAESLWAEVWGSDASDVDLHPASASKRSKLLLHKRLSMEGAKFES